MHIAVGAEMSLARYKYVVQVVIGEQRGEGVRMGSRCFWDSDTDNVASETYVNVRTVPITPLRVGAFTEFVQLPTTVHPPIFPVRAHDCSALLIIAITPSSHLSPAFPDYHDYHDCIHRALLSRTPFSVWRRHMLSTSASFRGKLSSIQGPG